MLGLVLSLLAGAPPASAFPDLWKGWEPLKERDGIVIYQRKVADSSLVDFGGEAVLEGSVEKLCAILEDLARQPEWVESLSEIALLERKTPADYVYFQRFHLSWPLSDRDFVVRHLILPDAERRRVTFHEVSVEHPKRPPDDCCVRAVMHVADLHLAPVSPERTAVAAIARVDLEGNIPKWLVNWVQEDFPINSFVGYRKQLAKRIDVPPVCRSLLP